MTVSPSAQPILRQPIQLAVLLPQVADIRLDADLLAGGAAHDVVLHVLAPVPVDVLSEPAVQRGELAAGDLLLDLRMGAQGGGIELRTQDVADRVAVKAAAHAAAIP